MEIITAVQISLLMQIPDCSKKLTQGEWPGVQEEIELCFVNGTATNLCKTVIFGRLCSRSPGQEKYNNFRMLIFSSAFMISSVTFSLSLFDVLPAERGRMMDQSPLSGLTFRSVRETQRRFNDSDFAVCPNRHLIGSRLWDHAQRHNRKPWFMNDKIGRYGKSAVR